MKKLMSLVLALAMILSLAACGGKTTGTSPDSAGDSQQETPATSDGAFPEKQITIIMPWSLGGGPDTIARQVASYGEKYLGVPVIVENHTGGSGTIAMNDALQAEDDGYTMVVANGPLFSLTPSFINVNYTLDDITPLIGMRITEFVVLTNSQSGITNIDELKAYDLRSLAVKELRRVETIVQDAVTAVDIDDERTALVLVSLTPDGNICTERTYYAMICEIDATACKVTFHVTDDVA